MPWCKYIIPLIFICHGALAQSSIKNLEDVPTTEVGEMIGQMARPHHAVEISTPEITNVNFKNIRTVQTIYPDGETSFYKYNIKGKIEYFVANRDTFKYIRRFNKYDRLVLQFIQDKDNLSLYKEIKYNKKGQITKEIFYSPAYYYKGRKTEAKKSECTYDWLSNDHYYKIEYDENKNIVCEYDVMLNAQGEIISVYTINSSYKEHSKQTATYNQNKQIVKLLFENGFEKKELKLQRKYEFTYNEFNKIVSTSYMYLSSNKMKTDTSIWTCKYKYLNNGSVQREERRTTNKVLEGLSNTQFNKHGDFTNNTTTDSFGNQVITSSNYEYDERGNWIKQTEINFEGKPEVTTRTLTYFE